MYNSGMTRGEIGNLFGVNAGGVYSAFKRHGLTVRTPKEAGRLSAIKRIGDNHPRRKNPSPIKKTAYRSMRIVDADGKIHKRRVHVIKMEDKIGRRLYENECVHHIDGNRHNNDIENLELMTREDHGRHEIAKAHRERPESFRRLNGKFIGKAKSQQCGADQSRQAI